jgi:hypothetical protein
MEVRKHSSMLYSILDKDCPVEFSARKLDFLYDRLLEHNPVIFFVGYKLDYRDENFEVIVSSLASGTAVISKGEFSWGLKAKDIYSATNRSMLQSAAKYFEYPTLFFLRDSSNERKLLELIESGKKVTEVCKSIEACICTYLSIEHDVLWIECNSDSAEVLADLFASDSLVNCKP